MPPPATAIHKSVRGPRIRKATFLPALPADVSAQIIDRLRSDDLALVPRVHPSWAALFAAGSPLEPALRALVVHRFGLRHPPPYVRASSWGTLYLALRRERCHLCPARYVAPFVYAGSSSLALMLQCGGQDDADAQAAGLALFPVCKGCFCALIDAPRDYFVPVVESRAVGFVFPSLVGHVEPRAVEKGFMYSDLPAFNNSQSTRNVVEYVSARPLAKACPHRFQPVAEGERVQASVPASVVTPANQ